MSATETLLGMLQKEWDECTEILKLVQNQNRNLVAQATDELMLSAADLEQKTRTLRATRRQREIAQGDLSALLGTEPSFEKMVPALPEGLGQQVQKLVERINRRLQAIKRTAEQNQRLAETSVQVRQELIRQVQVKVALSKRQADANRLGQR
jgi:flagellar FlgN protein